jgi:hypothetical protein
MTTAVLALAIQAAAAIRVALAAKRRRAYVQLRQLS